MHLDALDYKILYELEKNSRIQSKPLARKVQASHEVVSYRIKRLKERGILRSCTAIVDMSKLGYLTFRIYIRWQNIDMQEKQKFFDYIGKYENIWTTTELHGKWDAAFFLGIKQTEYIQKFHSIWNDILSTYKEKIAETKIAIYAPVHNFNKRFFSDKTEVVTRVTGEGHIVEHDELDEEILKAFSPDVRQNLSQLAAKVESSIETVRRRIKQLEATSVIVGYKVDLDLGKLNHQGYRVDFTLNSMQRNAELFEYIKQHKYFYQINKSIGGADFECEIVVENLQHLLETLETIMKKFRGVVKNYEYMGYTNFPKLSIVSD